MVGVGKRRSGRPCPPAPRPGAWLEVPRYCHGTAHPSAVPGGCARNRSAVLRGPHRQQVAARGRVVPPGRLWRCRRGTCGTPPPGGAGSICRAPHRLSPHAFAIERVLQCVAPAGIVSKVVVVPAPGRGSSSKPSQPSLPVGAGDPPGACVLQPHLFQLGCASLVRPTKFAHVSDCGVRVDIY